MEWYIAAILLLGAALIGAIVLISEMMNIIDALRIENSTLKIDLLHK